MTIRAHCQVTTFDATSNAVMTAATVNVYTPGTVTPIPATIYDRLGNVLSNPLTSDATTGLCDFYLLVAQEVDLVVSKSAFTTRTYSNVPVLDDSSLELTALLTTTGDMPYASSANSPARLPIGTVNQSLMTVGGVPAWTAHDLVAIYAQTNSFSTASASMVAITSASVTLTTRGSNVLIWFNVPMTISTQNAVAVVGVKRDSGSVTSVSSSTAFAANQAFMVSGFFQDTSVAAGSHTWQLYTDTTAGTLTVNSGVLTQLLAVEMSGT